MGRWTIIALVLALTAAGGYFGRDRLWPADETAPAPQEARGGTAEVVTAEPAATAAVSERIESVGTARARESVVITARAQGEVRTLAFDDGARVERGRVLVRLDTEIEEAELDTARAELERTGRAHERASALRARGTASAAALEEAEAALHAARAQVALAEARLERRTVTAPFAGVLGFRQISPGAFVSPGDPIATLVDITEVDVDFRVPEDHLGRLAPGQPVLATTRAYGGRTFAGRVREVDTTIDPLTRQAVVRATIANPDDALRPGMLMQVVLVTGTRESVVVPDTAVVPVGPSAYVFLVDADGRALRRAVRTGQREAGRVEIVSGLAPGEWVVIEGAAKLSDGDRLDVRSLEDSPVADLLGDPAAAPGPAPALTQ
ncbi:efflux RND transporter periplasmic adaptor subunit [Azospirillum halopraeferens]|uniref:efflux RND transporter periplasmic adaptor subunit n=1 Tax=Azospirillum halopraeferens TaxID=34010 RepID=UPI00042A7C3E|nr:efflux RND transporter periplasmic adaptor subunit [Azospirillum halopraeferens]